MKKMLFFLSFGALLLISSSSVFAMEEAGEAAEYFQNNNKEDIDQEEVTAEEEAVRREDAGVLGGVFRRKSAYHRVYPTKVVFMRKDGVSTKISVHSDKHFIIDNERNESSDLSFDEDDYAQLENDGWHIFSSKKALDKAFEDRFSLRTMNARFDAGKAEGVVEGRRLAANERPFHQKHAGKLILLTSVGGFTAGGLAAYYYMKHNS